MDLIPHNLGGDDYYLNGSYNKLQNAGAAYGLPGSGSSDGDTDTENEPDETTENAIAEKQKRRRF